MSKEISLSHTRRIQQNNDLYTYGVSTKLPLCGLWGDKKSSDLFNIDANEIFIDRPAILKIGIVAIIVKDHKQLFIDENMTQQKSLSEIIKTQTCEEQILFTIITDHGMFINFNADDKKIRMLPYHYADNENYYTSSYCDMCKSVYGNEPNVKICYYCYMRYTNSRPRLPIYIYRSIRGIYDFYKISLSSKFKRPANYTLLPCCRWIANIIRNFYESSPIFDNIIIAEHLMKEVVRRENTLTNREIELRKRREKLRKREEEVAILEAQFNELKYEEHLKTLVHMRIDVEAKLANLKDREDALLTQLQRVNERDATLIEELTELANIIDNIG